LRAVTSMHWLWKHCLINYMKEELSDVICKEITLPRIKQRRRGALFTLLCGRVPGGEWLPNHGQFITPSSSLVRVAVSAVNSQQKLGVKSNVRGENTKSQCFKGEG